MSVLEVALVVIGTLIARSLFGALVRLVIALGVTALAAKADELPMPVVVVVGLVLLLSWIAALGSFVVAVIDLVHNWN